MNNELGPWEIDGPQRGYSSRPYWIIRRRNPEFNRGLCCGWEVLSTKTDDRRFYSEAAALKEAAKLNRIK